MALLLLMQLGIFHPPLPVPDVMDTSADDLAMGLHPLCYHTKQRRMFPCGMSMPERTTGNRDV